MDRLAINAPFTSHGRNPSEAGDLSQAWAQAYWKYKNLGLSESLAAKAACALKPTSAATTDRLLFRDIVSTLSAKHYRPL